MEQQIEQYCRQLKALLRCPPEDAKRCIDDVRRNIERLRTEQPGITEKEIWGFMGKAEDVAQMFLDLMDPERLHQYRRRRKLFFRLLVAVLVAALCGAMYAAYYFITTPQEVSSVTVYVHGEHPFDGPAALDP